jgi:radical SAM protein with 4Fe4S-binding SPASM domain
MTKIPSGLLTSKRTSSAMLELTTDCDVRCVYCARSRPVYAHKSKTIDLSKLDSIIAYFKNRRLKDLVFAGYGEITVLKDWHLHASKFFNKGFSVRIETNLTKEFSNKEVRVLARFKEIIASCDTVGEKLFRRLRGGREISTLLRNMEKVRSAASENGYPEPQFCWSCVVCDKNVKKLQDLVLFGIEIGVKSFEFNDLVEYSDTGDPGNLYPIAKLPKKELLGIPNLFNKISDIIKKNGGVGRWGGDNNYWNNIIESVEDKLNGKNYMHRQKRGMTRDCLRPWNEVCIHADGSITHCRCLVASERLGSLEEGKKMDEILNNDTIKGYREGILSGVLNESCRGCLVKGWIGIDTLREKVVKYLSGDKSL